MKKKLKRKCVSVPSFPPVHLHPPVFTACVRRGNLEPDRKLFIISLRLTGALPAPAVFVFSILKNIALRAG